MPSDIQATGITDAAYRAAEQAQEFEDKSEFQKALEFNEEATRLYRDAATDYKLKGGADKGVIRSLTTLAETHER